MATGSKYRISAVCLGNICRSPIAEAVLTARFGDNGLGNIVQVDSAGTSGWHIGEDADPRTRRVLDDHDYQLSHSAKQFAREHFADRDLILVMDRYNLEDLRSIAPENALEKIRLLRSFDPDLAHLPDNDARLDVPDPYSGGADGFIDVLQMIEAASGGVVDHVRIELAERL